MDWTTHSQGPSTTRKCCCRTINCRRTSNSEMITPHGALLQALSAWYRSSCRSPLILHHMCASINDPTTPVCACELQAGGLGHVKCHVYCGGISKRLKVTWRLELAALLGCGWFFLLSALELNEPFIQQTPDTLLKSWGQSNPLINHPKLTI